MSIQRIAGRYAKSLIDLSKETGKLDRILEDVQSFNEVCKNKDFKLMLKSPIVSADKKGQVFEKLFEGKYDEMTLAFFKILLKKGREPLLAEIGAEFVEQYKRHNHVSTVNLTTATPMTKEGVQAIKDKLLAGSGTDQKIELHTKVDPNIIGGFILEFDNKLYDTSVAHKLELLKTEFKDNLYISQIVA